MGIPGARASPEIPDARLVQELRARTDELARRVEELDTAKARFCVVFQFDGELIHVAAHHDLTPARIDAIRRNYPMRPSRDRAAARAVLDRAVTEIPHVDADPDYGHRTAPQVAVFKSLVASCLCARIPWVDDSRE
jgi:hypothetical protein